MGTYNGLLEVQVTRDRETGKLITTCEHRVLGSSQGTLFTSKIDLGALLYDRVGKTHGMYFAGSEQKNQTFFIYIVKRMVLGLKEILWLY